MRLNDIRERLRAHSPEEEEEEGDFAAPPRAAVAAILREREHPEVLLIRRAEHPSDPWSGHMAFPGGRLEATDPSLHHASLRETREEIGLDLAEHGEVIGRLDDVPTHKTGLIVRPFVYVVESVPPLRPNREVAGVYWVDLPSLMSGARDTEYPLVHEGKQFRFPAYQVDEHVVWGLTYRMLQILFQALSSPAR